MVVYRSTNSMDLLQIVVVLTMWAWATAHPSTVRTPDASDAPSQELLDKPSVRQLPSSVLSLLSSPSSLKSSTTSTEGAESLTTPDGVAASNDDTRSNVTTLAHVAASSHKRQRKARRDKNVKKTRSGKTRQRRLQRGRRLPRNLRHQKKRCDGNGKTKCGKRRLRNRKAKHSETSQNARPEAADVEAQASEETSRDDHHTGDKDKLKSTEETGSSGPSDTRETVASETIVVVVAEEVDEANKTDSQGEGKNDWRKRAETDDTVKLVLRHFNPSIPVLPRSPRRSSSRPFQSQLTTDLLLRNLQASQPLLLKAVEQDEGGALAMRSDNENTLGEYHGQENESSKADDRADNAESMSFEEWRHENKELVQRREGRRPTEGDANALSLHSVLSSYLHSRPLAPLTPVRRSRRSSSAIHSPQHRRTSPESIATFSKEAAVLTQGSPDTTTQPLPRSLRRDWQVVGRPRITDLKRNVLRKLGLLGSIQQDNAYITK